MRDSAAFFVQFPHPGGEHTPSTADMLWNAEDHRRKFLVAPGRYLDTAGRIHEAELVFWGEWEPPSRVVHQWHEDGDLPRFLHRPYWGKPSSSDFRQNTDPWVFGETMVYSNCKQLGPRPARRPNSMQKLSRGSVICFGSTRRGDFCIDTVFVVASAEPWVPADTANLGVDAAFKTCTAESLMTNKDDRYLTLTLYRGATFDEPVEGMYSFVPARPADTENARFRRPTVHHELINPANRQATWGSNRPLPIGQVRRAWEGLRKQVLTVDLVLAVSLRTPDQVTEAVPIPASHRQSC